ncbi:MAG: TetR/AcrR family transcriptional regulator [Xanthobacteraceae bacterium]|jgi:AcrR family transcriptional regulator|nr:TetR/AcrR family transcriptional regulator [Xanthobacteraceae bacterium]
MGRQRSIDRDAVLDAAERVVVRDGAANLTLEAVAAEAGISKASVLYDYKTKRALIRTLIERRVAADEELVQRFVDAQAERPDARIRGYIAATTRSFSDEERSVGLNLCAALAQDEALREPVQQSLRATIAEIETSSAHPRGAMLAFLSIQGLMLLDWFGLYNFSPPERERLIAEIGWLIQQSPPSAL